MNTEPREAVITDRIRDTIIDCIVSAGNAVMQVYETDFNVDVKQDNTPITEADRAADSIIRRCLDSLPLSFGGVKKEKIPILSEEGREIPCETRSEWKAYWLVDPLDGTKEFVHRNGEFTINIALIERSAAGYLPSAGFVYLPVLHTLYWGIYGSGAYRLQIGQAQESADEARNPDRLPPPGGRDPDKPVRIVASRSHLDPKTGEYIDGVRAASGGKVELVRAGSSLKLCRIAEGSADLYPRFGPTMEWDIAAGHGVCRAAGCRVVDLASGKELSYNKASLKNGHFLAGKPETVKKYIPAGR